MKTLPFVVSLLLLLLIKPAADAPAAVVPGWYQPLLHEDAEEGGAFSGHSEREGDVLLEVDGGGIVTPSNAGDVLPVGFWACDKSLKPFVFGLLCDADA